MHPVLNGLFSFAMEGLEGQFKFHARVHYVNLLYSAFSLNKGIFHEM